MGMADWKVALGNIQHLVPAVDRQHRLRVPEGGMKRRLSEADDVVVDIVAGASALDRYPLT